MNTANLTRARKLFDIPGVPRKVVRHNMRQWVRSVRYLGDKWVVRRNVPKTAEV